MQIRAIQERDALQSLVPQWQALADSAAEPNPFFEPWNILPALDLDAGTPTCLYGFEGDQLVGFVPLIQAKGYARLPVTYWQSWIHPQSFFGSPLVLPGSEAAFLVAILNWADNSGRGRFTQFQKLDATGPFAMALMALTGRVSYCAHKIERAALRSDLPYTAYIEKNIRSKKRKEMRRLDNRLAEEGHVRFEELTATNELEHWGEMFLTVEDASWKGTKGTSLKAQPQTRDYFHTILKGAFMEGRLLFQRLMLDDKPLAMLVNFVSNRRVFSYKIAFDDAFSRYSPGVMIELNLTKEILDNNRADFVDSCAAENHPMINHLWAERRAISMHNVSLTQRFGGPILSACRRLEEFSARKRDAS